MITDLLDKPLLMEPNRAQSFLRQLTSAMSADSSGKDLSTLLGAGSSESASSDHIEIIRIAGILTNRISWTANYREIGSMIQAAADDPAVDHIVLDIESPGGEAGGVFDLSDLIYSLRDKKPITAIAGEYAFSAAYAIASAAHEVIVSRTAEVGSVGVVMMHRDLSEAHSKAGINVSLIHAGAHKVDGNPFQKLPKSVQDRWQHEVNDIYNIFVETVARNRGLSSQAVRKTEALTYAGHKAVTAGLADRVESHQTTISKIMTTDTETFLTQMTEKQAMSDYEPDNTKHLVADGWDKALSAASGKVKTEDQEGIDTHPSTESSTNANDGWDEAIESAGGKVRQSDHQQADIA